VDSVHSQPHHSSSPCCLANHLSGVRTCLPATVKFLFTLRGQIQAQLMSDPCGTLHQQAESERANRFGRFFASAQNQLVLDF
jgi:hypothetical protein